MLLIAHPGCSQRTDQLILPYTGELGNVAINAGLNVQQTSASAKECEPKADCADTKVSWHGNAHTVLVFTCADTKLCNVSTGNERERNLSNAHLSWHGNAHTEGAIAELRKY